MRKIILGFLLVANLALYAQSTTYIPRYKSYIEITHLGDTICCDNVQRSLDLKSKDGKFTISVQHEDVTRQKVKAIKRAKAAAGWELFDAVTATVFPGQRGSSFSRVQDMKVSKMFVEMADENAQAEQILNIEVWIENLTDKELMMADMDRGTIWYIQPRHTLSIGIPNPCETMFRISDINNQSISFATVAAGSVVKKEVISYQDDKCWVLEVTKKNRRPENKEIIGYMYVDRETFENVWMTIKEFDEFLKKHQK